jgi:cytochrome c-type biogenesis protein CcmH/NrfF
MEHTMTLEFIDMLLLFSAPIVLLIVGTIFIIYLLVSEAKEKKAKSA